MLRTPPLRAGVLSRPAEEVSIPKVLSPNLIAVLAWWLMLLVGGCRLRATAATGLLSPIRHFPHTRSWGLYMTTTLVQPDGTVQLPSHLMRR